MLVYFDYTHTPNRDDFSFVPPVLKYDSIVDSSKYRPDSDVIREFLKKGPSNAASVGRGIYDYNSKDDLKPENMVTDTELALRSKQLTLAEVSDLQRQATAVAEKQVSDAKDKKAKEKKEKMAEAVDKALADTLGVSADHEPSSE